ncbi:Spermidine synthase [hydrothermal vent metagenome]|uniref:Spermidine synthase n=1 Tax=hydrothermal vent metagenome TaxID=652676 RepID=A0A3B1CIH1_9ZZZZ
MTEITKDSGSQVKTDFVDGDHFHVWLAGCFGLAMTDGAELGKVLSDAANESGLGVLDVSKHSFEGGGCSATVLLSESHLAAHTWPERDGLTLLDISTCNHSMDNKRKAERCVSIIKKQLNASRSISDNMSYAPRFSEPRAPGQGVWIEAKETLLDIDSKYQRVQVVRTEGMGITLIIDGLFQVSEADEEFYHEPLVHPAMLAVDTPKDVLIIGGGDGGAIKHALRHPAVESVDLVEIDEEVIKAARQYLGKIHENSFDDPRVRVNVVDAFEYLDSVAGQKDVIILDITDPVGPCERLFTEEFMDKVAKALKPGGLASVHLGFPVCWPEASRMSYDAVKGAFKNVSVCHSYVPLYAELMGFAIMSNDVDTNEAVKGLGTKLAARSMDEMEIVSEETIGAMFALAPKLKKVFGIK